VLRTTPGVVVWKCSGLRTQVAQQFQERRKLRDPWLFGRTQHCSLVCTAKGAQAAAAVGMTIKIQAKVCSACKHKLPWSDFAGSQWQASHHHRHCKTCAKKQRLTLNARGRGRLPSQLKCSGDWPRRIPRHGDSAILVREPFATLIIQGQKTMEVRGVATSKRERVWIVSIDTRRILGDVCIIGCTRFQKEDAATLYDQHQIPESVFNTMSYRKYFGYILTKPTPLNVAVFHKTYPGPQSFVHLKLH
jgi:hypothetical protein